MEESKGLWGPKQCTWAYEAVRCRESRTEQQQIRRMHFAGPLWSLKVTPVIRRLPGRAQVRPSCCASGARGRTSRLVRLSVAETNSCFPCSAAGRQGVPGQLSLGSSSLARPVSPGAKCCNPSRTCRAIQPASLVGALHPGRVQGVSAAWTSLCNSGEGEG